MQSEVRYEKGLSVKEKRLLSRLKLALLALTLIFFLHALPGRFVKEAFPITRWAMFSEPQQYPLELAREFEVTFTDTTGQVNTTTMSALYTPIVGNYAAIGASTAITLANTDDPELRADYEQAIAERIRAMYGSEPAEVEIAAVFYAVDLNTLPHIDLNAPTSRQFMTRFTVSEH
ncbi:MAG: hypothetical protein K8L99_04395 [Anaerolineae bacterium]|nr:hypothetical protein [Anaerolineae bacterium]